MTDITITQAANDTITITETADEAVTITEAADETITITQDANETITITEAADEAITLTVGVSEERVEDLVAALLTAGALITLSYDDDAGTLTISAEVEASDVEADTTSFDGYLSATDDTVQKALDTLDDITTFSLVVDTKDNIPAASPSVNVLAFATDTNEFYLYDGSDWRVAPLELQVEGASPDMGAYIADYLGTSDRMGYHSDNIDGKSITNSIIGGTAPDEEGAIRVVDGTFQIYANGAWNDVVINFVFREDASGAYELEHQPIGLEWYYEIMSGNSDKVGLNGRPLVTQYTADMGAYPYSYLEINGGSF